MSRFRWPKKM